MSHDPRTELALLLQRAWPVMVAQLGMMGLGVVDTWMLGQVDSGALASMALANLWSWSTAVLAFGCAAGLDPLLAQAWGANDQDGYDRALARGVGLVLLVSVPVMLLHLAIEPCLRALGQPEDALPLATTFGWILAPSIPAFCLFGALRGALQARGHTREALWVVALGNLANVVGNQVLIHGAMGWSGLGPAGSAWSTTLVRWLMCAALAAIAEREIAGLRRAWRELFALRAWGGVARVAFPVAVQIGTEVWAFNAAGVLIGWHGAPSVAAHVIALQYASVAFMVPLGLSSAVASRIGNLVGAGEPWEHVARLGVGVAAAWGVCSGTFFGLAPGPLVSVFIDRQDAAWAIAVGLMPFAAAFQVFDASQVVLFGALRGAGDTRLPSLANLLGYWLIGLPLGGLVARQIGVHGVWLGLVVSLALVSALLFGRLRWVMAHGARRVAA